MRTLKFLSLVSFLSFSSMVLAGTWSNTLFPAQSGSFSLSFDAVPMKNLEDTVIGISKSAANDYSNLAAIVRFNNVGTIDVRNGSNYQAASKVSYSAGVKYHFDFSVSISTHKYTVYVTPSGKSKVLLAQNYSFRSEQASVSSLSYFSSYNNVGGATISNVVLPAPVVAAPPAPVSLKTSSVTSESISLSWSSGGGSTSGYKIAYAQSATAPGCSSASSVSGTSFSLSGLKASSVYSFSLCAVNSLGVLSSAVNLSVNTLAVVIVPPAPAPVPGSISFKSTFEDGMITSSIAGAWQDQQTVSERSLQLVNSPVRGNARNSLRIEVNPGDKPLEGLNTERAEVLTMKGIDGQIINENNNSGTQFYAFSVMIPTDWQSPTDWGVIFQLHGCDAFSTSPSFAFSVYSPTYLSKVQDEFAIDLNGGLMSKAGSFANEKHYSFSNGAFKRGQWTDFVLEIKWSTQNNGYVNVSRRDEGQTNFSQVLAVSNVATLMYVPSVALPSRCGTDPQNPNHYWKSGLYRNASPVTNVLFMSGGPVRGSSFDAVVKAAFP